MKLIKVVKLPNEVLDTLIQITPVTPSVKQVSASDTIQSFLHGKLGTDTLEELLKEVIIAFDTDPKLYEKLDYAKLIAVLTKLKEYIESLTKELQSDWNETDETKADYIKNKPDILLSDWDQTDTDQIDYIKNKPEIVDPFYFDNYIYMNNPTYVDEDNLILMASNVVYNENDKSLTFNQQW